MSWWQSHDKWQSGWWQSNDDGAWWKKARNTSGGGSASSGASGGLTPHGQKQQAPPEEVFHLVLPFSPKILGPDWINQCKDDAARFDCTMSWRASRRTVLENEDESVPYTVTVTGKSGGMILKSLQEDIYRQWPLPTPPPRSAKIDGVTYNKDDDEEQSCVYSFNVPGQVPRTVRLYNSFTELAEARKTKPGGIKGKRLRSKVTGRWLDPADTLPVDIAPEDLATVPPKDPAA